MSFNKKYIARVTSSANENAPQVWSYISSGDNLATVVASAYFNEMIDTFALKAVIFIEASDDYMIARVTSVTTNVTVAEYGMAVVADGSITAAKLASDSVTTVKILDDNVTTAKILDDNITTAKILDANITTAKILDANVTTAKILDANVTLAKLATGITPTSVPKYEGKESNGGGSATVAITVTGVAATDVVFAQLEASTNAVNVQKVTPTTDTITVIFSGDPGAATIISYLALRTAT